MIQYAIKNIRVLSERNPWFLDFWFSEIPDLQRAPEKT